MKLPAPAKINRFLHLTGRRADGYHELETLFQFLDFADTLSFEALPRPRIRRIDRHDFALPDEDLSIRAARLLQETFPAAGKRGVAITVQKTIPPGSGLGGGSSNAATTLLALNHLWQLGLSRRRLAGLGLELGADVPVFVHGRAALGRGIGEQLEPANPAERWLCLCLPPVQVSTARVFSHAQLDPGPRGRRPAVGDADETGNDLEAVASLLYPEVGEALAQLRRHSAAGADGAGAGAGAARMSGSGGAVYAEFDTRAEAQRAAAQLPADFTAVVTRSRNRHPMLDFPG